MTEMNFRAYDIVDQQYLFGRCASNRSARLALSLARIVRKIIDISRYLFDIADFRRDGAYAVVWQKLSQVRY